MHSHNGFTLVELLVVMLASTVVMGGLVTLITVTVHQTTRTFNRIGATRRARTTLDVIETELHSACVATGVTPIQGGGANGSQVSNDTQLVFLSQAGTSPTLSPVEHQISFSGGTLTDTTYAVTGGAAPNWTFASSPSGIGTRLLTNVTQRVVSTKSVPVFQYFKYDVPRNAAGGAYVDATNNNYMILLDGNTDVPGTNVLPANSPQPLLTPLSPTDAAATAEVVITFVAGPGANVNGLGANAGTNLTDVSDTVTDSVVLRLTPVDNATANGNGATFGPCQ
jgi:prepilin-type N-terminal cleavage/methylation domain-containing protein